MCIRSKYHLLAEPCVGRELLSYCNILAKLHSAVVPQVNLIIPMKFAQKNSIQAQPQYSQAKEVFTDCILLPVLVCPEHVLTSIASQLFLPFLYPSSITGLP